MQKLAIELDVSQRVEFLGKRWIVVKVNEPGLGDTGFPMPSYGIEVIMMAEKSFTDRIRGIQALVAPDYQFDCA